MDGYYESITEYWQWLQYVHKTPDDTFIENPKKKVAFKT